MFHKCMEYRLRGRDIPDLDEQYAWAETPFIWDEWKKHKLWLPAQNWAPPAEWQIKHIETPMQAMIQGAADNNRIEGTLDAIVKFDGKWWSIQWKTYTTNLERLVQQVQIGWHESAAYPTLARAYQYQPFGGTLLGAVQKLPGYKIVQDQESGRKGRQDVTDQDRIDALSFHWIAFNQRKYEDRVVDLINAGISLENRLMFRNTDSCFGIYGNSKCQYYGVCHEGEDINGPGFITIEPRYGTIDEC